MKTLDTVFAWMLAFLGAAHFLAAWVPVLVLLRGPWVEGTGVAIIAAGFMNAVRSRRSSDRFLRWSTALVTGLTAALCLSVLYHFSGNVLHQPAALGVAALAAIEFAFSVAG